MCIIPKFISSEVTVNLVKAKQLVEDGWCQHLPIQITEERYNYCAIGAMQSVVIKGNVNGLEKIVNIFVEANGIVPSDGKHCGVLMGKVMGITKWNDAKGRTKEEVLNAFDKAINYVG